ncbi:MAG TPA: type II toxin-antitoxin system VapC family toxin [Bryobacteraceae bacterium]
MKAIDTNVLVRLIVRDDARQAEKAERFIESGAWISTAAMAEATWVLRSVYGLRPNQIANAVAMLLEHESLVLQDSETIAAALEIFRARPSLGFSDCLMLEMARQAGHLPLGTFDRDLSQMSGAQRL